MAIHSTQHLFVLPLALRWLSMFPAGPQAPAAASNSVRAP